MVSSTAVLAHPHRMKVQGGAGQNAEGRHAEGQHAEGYSTIRPRWKLDIPDGSLAVGQVHLWAVDLSRLQGEQYTALLTAPELGRAERYLDRKQGAMYRGGRIGLRILLHAYAGIANSDLRFANSARGKPSLHNALPGGELSFNYTLSANRALYALAWNRQVGIDLETWPRKINAPLMARRKLAAVEQQTWNNIPLPCRDQAMLACWTRKEAYGKALGVGIRYAINQVPVFVAVDSPLWRCRVAGLFESPSGGKDTRVMHGIQLSPPFPGVAALVYDGKVLDSPAAGKSLQGRRLHLE